MYNTFTFIYSKGYQFWSKMFVIIILWGFVYFFIEANFIMVLLLCVVLRAGFVVLVVLVEVVEGEAALPLHVQQVAHVRHIQALQ